MRHDKLNCFYARFRTEILLTAQNEGHTVQIKNEVQKQVLLKKHFFFFLNEDRKQIFFALNKS